MNAIFNKNSSSKKYQWKNLGNISIGRPDLGDTVPVAIYRQLEFSLIEVLTRRYGSKEANDIFREAGFIAGVEFARFHLNTHISKYSIIFRKPKKFVVELSVIGPPQRRLSTSPI